VAGVKNKAILSFAIVVVLSDSAAGWAQAPGTAAKFGSAQWIAARPAPERDEVVLR